jgi:hypothetical protein
MRVHSFGDFTELEHGELVAHNHTLAIIALRPGFIELSFCGANGCSRTVLGILWRSVGGTAALERFLNAV